MEKRTFSLEVDELMSVLRALRSRDRELRIRKKLIDTDYAHDAGLAKRIHEFHQNDLDALHRAMNALHVEPECCNGNCNQGRNCPARNRG